MFCKKILSFICVLFIGSQLSIVKAGSSCGVFTVEGNGCDVSGCTVGDDYGYYFVSGKIVKVTGESLCSVEETKGYYKMKYEGGYYSYNGSTYAAVTHSAGNNNHGQIDETSGLNLDASGNKIAFGGGEGSYLLTDINKIFSVSSDTKVSVKSDGDSIVLDTSFDGNDYCVDGNKKIAERSDNWCSSTSNECTYYDCVDGDCIVHGTIRTYCDPMGDPDTEQVKCIENGYYLMDQSTQEIITTEGNSGDLYLCKQFETGTITCKKVGAGSGETGQAVPTGFLVNSGAGSGTGKYIKCNFGTCTAIGLVTEYGASELIDDCSHANVNDIILVGGTNMFICLAKTSAGGLKIASNDNNRQFFVDVYNSETIFGTTTSEDFKYLLVDLNGGNAILHAKDNARYKYADDASLEIFGRKSENICERGSLKGSASEFKKLEVENGTSEPEVDYYQKISTE